MTTTTKRLMGFALLPKDRMRDIASQGGRTAHREGRAHEFTTAEASAAGKKGAEAKRRKRLAQAGSGGA